ncbi:MAG: group 1 truncated hemoglobin [Ignavibacteriae bacterium]|nr:group 1 truncated hemoglobin [Ignavibacteriota bacterium]
MKKSIAVTALCLLALSLVFSACSDSTTSTPAPTLYERVGGTTMITDPSNPSTMIEKGRLTLRSVVDSSILVIAADAQLAKYFPVLFAELGASNTSGLSALSKNFTDFLCSATGSKNTAYSYTGKSMKDAHNPASNSRMGALADSADFDKFVGDIGVGLAQNGVTVSNNKQLVDDLVALLNTTKADIVQR